MLIKQHACSYLFVYGTLCRQSRHPAYYKMMQDTVYIGTGSYQGKLYRVEDYPGVVPSSIPDETVYGEIVFLPNVEMTLSRLDEYEECSTRFPEPKLYRREIVTVTSNKDQKMKAWIYLYNRPVDHLIPIPSGRYVV